MGNGYSTIWPAVVLVLMAIALFATRGFYLAQSNTCARQLRQSVPGIERYASAHHGQLPTTEEELEHAIGKRNLHQTGTSTPYMMRNIYTRWKKGAPQPYLIDPRPHPFISVRHALYTDGSVREVSEEDLPTEPHYHL